MPPGGLSLIYKLKYIRIKTIYDQAIPLEEDEINQLKVFFPGEQCSICDEERTFIYDKCKGTWRIEKLVKYITKVVEASIKEASGDRKMTPMSLGHFENLIILLERLITMSQVVMTVQYR